MIIKGNILWMTWKLRENTEKLYRIPRFRDNLKSWIDIKNLEFHKVFHEILEIDWIRTFQLENSL